MKTLEIWLTDLTQSVLIGYGSRDTESRGGGTEDMEALWTLHCTVFLHFLLFPFERILARYKWRQHKFYHLPMEVEFTREPNLPKGRH